MKETWEIIEQVVESSTLGRSSKTKVLQKLDENLGKYSICHRIPTQVKGLDEEEIVIYHDIIKTINEATNAPKVKNEKQYNAVMQDIFNSFTDTPSKDISKMLVKIDLAHEEGDYDTVNKYFSKIWSKL